MTTTERLASPELVADQIGEAAAWDEAKNSFVAFLDYVYMLEPPQAGALTVGGKTKFQKWPHLLDLAEKLERPWIMRREGRKPRPEDLKQIWGKSRQIGASWLVAAFADWLALFYDGVVIPMMSQGETEASILLEKSKFIHENLPESWQRPLDKDSDSMYSFKGWHSYIRALPSTKKAGRSITGSVVILDEADYHEWLQDALASIQPIIASGGQLILLSTWDKRKAESMYQAIFREAVRGTNGYSYSFIGCFERPGRDEEWYQNEMRSIPEKQLRGMNRRLFMEQEYPRSLQEMMSPPDSISYFDGAMLAWMLEMVVKSPMISDGIINIYHKWAFGHRYSAGTDTSAGTGRDYSVTVVYDITAKRVVADIMSNTIKEGELAFESIKLTGLYKNPIWCIENNSYGHLVSTKAQEDGYPNLYYQRNTGVKGGNRSTKAENGFHTGEGNRPDLWGGLRESVNAGDVIIPNDSGLAQFFEVIENEAKGYRPEARSGAHDDYPVAVALALWVKDQATAHKGEIVLQARNW